MSAADRAIRASTTAAVLGVAGVAAYVSYWHAYEVVRAHGETGVTARLEPATIDGLVYCSSMVVLYAARHQLQVPALARWLLALGIVATLAANVAHGWSHGPVGAAVAAWPAASLVGSYELLLWLIRSAAAGPLVRGPAAGQAGGPAGQLTGWLSTGPLSCDSCRSSIRIHLNTGPRQAAMLCPQNWPAAPANRPSSRAGPVGQIGSGQAMRTGMRTSRQPTGPRPTGLTAAILTTWMPQP